MKFSLHSIAVLLLSGLLVGAAHATDERTLFRLNGLDYNEADLDDELRQRVFEAYAKYRDTMSAVMRDAIFELHVEEVAKETNRSVADVRQELAPKRVIADERLKAFYDQNRQRIRMPYDQVKGQIVEYLQRADQNAAKSELVSKLTVEGKLKELLPDAEAPSVKINTAGFPSKGPEDAAVTLVEFADYQCPHCKAAAPIVKDMLRRFKDKLRVVFVDFPINRSGISRLVAKGAVCAGQQGKFWEYHDLAFERQQSLSANSPSSLAGALELDKAAFDQCYGSQQAEGPIARAEAEARRLGVSSTPTIYVNGRKLRVVEGLAPDLDKAIQQALKATRA